MALLNGRVAAASLAQVSLNHVLADILLEPNVHGIGTLSWSAIVRAEQSGYECAMAAMDKIARAANRDDHPGFAKPVS